MSGLHYKKDGTLDMRYSSSKAAVTSGYGARQNTSGYDSYISKSSDSGLHYKKDGTLDMRYSSSKAAVTSGYQAGQNTSGYDSYNISKSSDSGLHYKKDGTLDMRYSSSKAAVTSGYGARQNTSGYDSYISKSSDSGLHYKKDGNLDMRYSSSKAATTSGYPTQQNTSGSDSYSRFKSGCSDLHYKKGGTQNLQNQDSEDLSDRHYKNELAKLLTKISVSMPTIPRHIPLTKAGLPDMRTAIAKTWVKRQAQESGDSIPDWIPKLKDGSINAAKVSQAIIQCLEEGNRKAAGIYDPEQRLNYYEKLLKEDKRFQQCVESTRKLSLPLLSASSVLTNTEMIQVSLAKDQLQSLSPIIQQISYMDLQLEPCVELGRGAFGVVLKGRWKGKVVAVKKTHLQQLSRKEKTAFHNEIKILGYLGQHTNLISLYAYVVDPPCLVLEYADLGSLGHLLHYEENLEIQANITDGRIKQHIVLGVACGMIQLHEVCVVHGDLKPQNVLITKDYTAKITDFGLATLRGKTSSSVACSTTYDSEHFIAGTGAYMAPELLDSTAPPALSSDVYSFGVLMNEVLSEEEPYCDQRNCFYGRGPFGAVNYAKLGNRPTIRAGIPASLNKFINSCWAMDSEIRPTFKIIASELQKPEMTFPNFF